MTLIHMLVLTVFVTSASITAWCALRSDERKQRRARRRLDPKYQTLFRALGVAPEGDE